MKRVLLVEDDEDLSAILMSTLAACGFSADTASSLVDADEALRHATPDLLVIDGWLPDGSGVDFIAELRPSSPDLPVVFLSAYFRDLSTFRRLTDELGVARVFYKPVDPFSFGRRVAELLHSANEDASDWLGTVSPELAEELNVLRQEFRVKLPSLLRAIEAKLWAARQDHSQLPAAKVLAHKLRGSAGSFGFHAVSNAVGGLDDMLSEADPLDRTGWRQVSIALRQAFVAASCGLDQAPEPPRRALLVVDRDKDFVDLVRSIARGFGLPLETAASVEDALRRARERPIVAALVDVQLVGDEAVSLVRQLRDTDDNGGMPIGFVSTDGDIETRLAALEAGGTRFFARPMREEHLRDAIDKFLESARSQQGRVLVVDDDSELRDHYARHLQASGFAVDTIGSVDTLVKRLEESHPDALVLDVDLPKVSGIDVCRALRMSERWELLPILIATASDDLETRLRAFRAGASDVIVKPVLAEELLARVGVQVERVRLIRERSDRDALSGLLLRRAFLEALQRMLARCKREQAPMSLVLLDIDHFKSVNDRYGHLAGDRVIAELGKMMQRRFRTEDLKARWGGEEFVLAFANQPVDFAVWAANRLLSALSAHEFRAEDDQPFRVSFTAGVAAYPEDASSVAEMIAKADERLYDGKRCGRDQIVGPR